MAKHVNIWKPDTCECEVEFEFDADAPQETREHHIVRVLKACDAHRGREREILGHENSNALHTENKLKNRMRRVFIDTLPANKVVTQDVVNAEVIDIKTAADGTETYTYAPSERESSIPVRELHPATRFQYYFDSERTLHCRIRGLTLTNATVTKTQRAADAQFGKGRVVVEHMPTPSASKSLRALNTPTWRDG